jgi:hypothetical protein
MRLSRYSSRTQPLIVRTNITNELLMRAHHDMIIIQFYDGLTGLLTNKNGARSNEEANCKSLP